MSDYDYESDEFENYDDGPPDDLDEFEIVGTNRKQDDLEVPQDYDQDLQQEMILSYVLNSVGLWSKCSPIMKPEYFTEGYRQIVEFAQNYYLEYKRLPSKSVLRGETGYSFDIPDDKDDPRTAKFISKRVENFCRASALRDLVLEFADDLNDPDKSYNTAVTLEQRLKKEVSLISITRDMGMEIHRDMAKALERAEESDGISTGIRNLDIVLGGGVTMPSFNLFSGSSGDGKSLHLANRALFYARQGLNVVFYTLELEEYLIAKRFASMMTEVPISRIYREKEAIEYKILNAGRTNGLLYIKKFPMVGTTIADISAHHNDLMTDIGEEFPVVFIDYLDLMQPLQSGIRADNIHIKDKYLTAEVNDFAHDPDFPKMVWSASQQIKGADKEKSASKSDVSGGTDKVNILDNLFIIKRSIEDYQDERGWLHIKKARSSGAVNAIVPYRQDSDTLLISDWPDDELFYEANPIRFARKDRNDSPKSNDPLVKEFKSELPRPPERPTGKERKGDDVRNRLMERFGKEK